MSNVVYRGPVEREPETISAALGAALKPAIFVKKTAGKFVASADSKGRLFVLSNDRYLETDITTEMPADQTANAYRIEPEQEYYMLAVTGNYSDQAELSCGADGKLKAAVAGETVLAFVDGAKNLAAEGYLDIVTANTYVKA